MCQWRANRNTWAGYRPRSARSVRTPNRRVVDRRTQIEHILWGSSITVVVMTLFCNSAQDAFPICSRTKSASDVISRLTKEAVGRSGYPFKTWLFYVKPFWPLDEAVASSAVFIIVPGSDGRAETLLGPAN